LAVVTVLVIVIVGAGFAILHLPAFESARNRIAADLLSSYFGETLVVKGGVDLTFGPTIDIDVRGVSPAAASGVQKPTVPVGRVRMSFAPDAALRGRLSLTALDLSSVRVIIDAAAAEPSKATLGPRISGAVETVLSSPLVRNLKLEDVSILRTNDPAGWNGTLRFDTVTSVETETAGTVSVAAEGSLNGQAFTLSGSIPHLAAASGAERHGDLSLKLAVKGVAASLDGRLTRDSGALALSARLDVVSPSLGDLQDLLQLARVAEGSGTLALGLEGPLAKLAISSATLRMETADGHVYEADGRIADIWSAEGVDVGFAATLVSPDKAKRKSRFDPAPRSIKGHLSSKGDGFEIDRVFVETGFASIELAHLGPVRIGLIGRDQDGHLRFEDIRLVQGDPQDPILDLTGHLNDVLKLRKFSLEGSFRLGMAVLLTGRQGASGVGAVRGEVAMSDASGALRLERLTAKLEDTDLMSLSLRLAKNDTSEPRMGLKFQIPDLARLASALGHKASEGLRIAFDGTLGAGDGAATVNGSGRIGATDLAGWLRFAVAKGRPKIAGKIGTQDLHLDDLVAAREVPKLFSDRKTVAVKLRDDVVDGTTLSLDLAADKVEGGGETAGGLEASLVYAKSRLRLSLARLSYLGGRIKGDLDAKLAASPPALALQGTVRDLSLEQVFERLDQAPAASGPLDLDLAVSAKGADLSALLASMSGQVSGSIREGSLADRTINLAGQTIIEWVFTRTADGSAPLVCLVARFDFEDGIATARQLVLETDKVQAVGAGTLDLRDQTMDFVFQPRPKQNDLVGEVGPVGVKGPLSGPEIQLTKGTVATKVIGETVGLPLHLLRPLLGSDGQPLPEHKPCVIVPDEP
jgi:uncharacterized protein involved in outer membrane biogenesis